MIFPIIKHVTPKPYANKKISIITVDIRKFTAPLVTIDIGNISLGKYTFFIIFPLPIIAYDACDTVVVKYVHGIKATHINIT